MKTPPWQQFTDNPPKPEKSSRSCLYPHRKVSSILTEKFLYGRKVPTYSVIVDLEATCCNQNSFPRGEMEIIEIGAVRVSSSTGEIESEFGAFVKPVRNPILTEFCRNLATILQEDLKDADSYPQVLAVFSSWLEEQPDYDFCSWGDYDKKQFMQDCQYHRLPYPFSGNHRNLKAEFSAATGGKKRFGLAACRTCKG